MKNIKKIVKLGLVGLLTVVMSLTVFGKEKLIVGTNAEFPPFEYLDNGKIVGFDIDLMAEIAKKIDVDVEYSNMAFDGLILALESEKIDLVIAGMTETEARKKFVEFSDNYFTAKQVLIVQKDAEFSSKLSENKEKKFASSLGNTGDLVLTKEGLKNQQFDKIAAAIMALKSKKVDAVIYDLEPSKNFVKNNPELKIVEIEADIENYSIAVKKGNIVLIEKINKALKEIKESGKYDELIKKYF